MHPRTLSVLLFATFLSRLPLAWAVATITTPASLTTCQPTLLTIGGDGVGPYYISVIPGGQVASAALETFPVVNASGRVTWLVNLAAGKLARFSSVSLAYGPDRGLTNSTCLGVINQ